MRKNAEFLASALRASAEPSQLVSVSLRQMNRVLSSLSRLGWRWWLALWKSAHQAEHRSDPVVSSEPISDKPISDGIRQPIPSVLLLEIDFL